MAMPFGVSFLPSGDAEYRREAGPGGANPVQQAIQILSMRVPRIVGANPLAPLSLLTGQGGQGLPPGLLERLLQQQMPGGNQGGPPPLSRVPPPQTQAAPPILPPQVPTAQVPPPMGPGGPPVMSGPKIAPPPPAPAGPVISGAPSPSAPPPPQPPQVPPPQGKPKIDFQPGPYNPEPGPSLPPYNPWEDVEADPGSPNTGSEALTEWAQAQQKRRRMTGGY